MQKREKKTLKKDIQYVVAGRSQTKIINTFPLRDQNSQTQTNHTSFIQTYIRTKNKCFVVTDSTFHDSNVPDKLISISEKKVLVLVLVRRLCASALLCYGVMVRFRQFAKSTLNSTAR